MILGALVDYYKILADVGEIPPMGYCNANVSFALRLSPEGVLLGVIPLKIPAQRGKKTVEVPRSMLIPEQETRTVGVKSNFLCDNSSYVLGIDKNGKPERTKQCFQAFCDLHHNILDSVDCIPAKAILVFLDTWNPEDAETCFQLQDYWDELLAGANIVFFIDGYGYAHQSQPIKQAWETLKQSNTEPTVMQCLVTGEYQHIARLHPFLKGIKGAQTTGASLVSFNANAYESYGHENLQGLNAPVSEYAAFAYATALNHLLSDHTYKQSFGDTTVVYWAQSTKKIYQDIFNFSLNPTISTDTITADSQTQSIIASVFQKIIQGKPIEEFKDVFNPDAKFYILGLAPNAARASVRFYYENSFGNILENQAKHYRDFEIEHSPKDYDYIPAWKILQETVSPKAKEKIASPLLSGSVMRSIFMAQPYPKALFNSVMVRIRAEREINRTKAAIIKACLIRSNYNTYKEELTVSLNEQSQNQAYILGRLFAVLEKAQQDANPGINSTIKERYFASACATPASVFPILLRLSNHHISKSDYGYISERRISDLMDKLDVENNPFPAHLPLEDQGIFVLGYYHQQKANYTKKTEEEK